MNIPFFSLASNLRSLGGGPCANCQGSAQQGQMQILQVLTELLGLLGQGGQNALRQGPSFGDMGGGFDPGLGSFLGGCTGAGMLPVPGSTAGMPGTGQGSAAVDWAESQLGVSESANPEVVRGYSRGADQAWCADFVSTALAQSGGSPFGHQSSVQGILDWGQANGRFISNEQAAADPSCLREGDVAVWKEDGRSHVGLVTGVAGDGTFSTIEGNTSDQVARRQHSFGERGLTGFVRASQG